MRIHFDLPAGWPWSTWFFIVTLVVYLLQRFPLTGVFLMIVGAAFWSILLINLGMIGIMVEAMTGKVSPLWLALPALYFGGFYAAYFHDQATLAKLRAETARFNTGKSFAFDPARQNLLIFPARDGSGLMPQEFVERFGLGRAFSNDGRVKQLGTDDTCRLINSDRAFLTAGIQGYFISRPGKLRAGKRSAGLCMVTMPRKPSRPAVRITQQRADTSRAWLPYSLSTFLLRDSDGHQTEIRSGWAGPLRPFPMWVMGCALNSGAASWDCFHGFMRADRTPLTGTNRKDAAGSTIVARVLGLSEQGPSARNAIGTEPFQPIADRIKAEAVAKDRAILEQMLADPTGYIRDGWLRHLPDRPEIVAPYAARIFDALEQVQAWDRESSETGRNLATLVAKMSDETLEPFRPRLVALLEPMVARPWIKETTGLYERLDVADAHQREIVLDRLEQRRGDLATSLLQAFCSMGAEAPDDAKRRLLALWHQRAPKDDGGGRTSRAYGDPQLYLTLARMGLRTQAGRVEQRYQGPTYRGIWDHVGPRSPADLCSASDYELSRYFRQAGKRT